eukprot:1595106-Pyramimonas_sp.AAC.1
MQCLGGKGGGRKRCPPKNAVRASLLTRAREARAGCRCACARPRQPLQAEEESKISKTSLGTMF